MLFEQDRRSCNRLRRKLDRPEIADASLSILTFEIALDDQLSVLENNKTVDIPHTPFSNRLIEPSAHLGGEFVGSKRGLLLPRSRHDRQAESCSSQS